MQLKTASAIAIACLSIGALLNFMGDIWTHHRLLMMGVKTSWLSLVADAIQVMLFHGSLILFFVVLYRNQTKDFSSR